MKAHVVENGAIKVLGKAEEGSIRKLLRKDFTSAKNSGWFFIDYSSYDFPLQSRFNLLPGKDTSEANADIVLHTVIDSFGNIFKDGIPKGFKTVAEFLFQGNIPIQLQNLPPLKGWHSTPDELWLSNTSNTKPDDYLYIDDLYKLLLFDLQNECSDVRHVYIEVVLTYFSKRKITNSKRLLETLIQRGFIEKTDERTLNLQIVD